MTVATLLKIGLKVSEKKKSQSHLTICRNEKKVVKNSLIVSFFHLQMTSWEHCVNVSPITPIFMVVVC